jgi:hypothetical protein
VGIGAALAMLGAFALFLLGGLNLAWAAGGDTESPWLNAAFGALFIVAGIALLSGRRDRGVVRASADSRRGAFAVGSCTAVNLCAPSSVDPDEARTESV